MVDGPLQVSTRLVIPQNLHDAVETELRTPRQNFSKMPEQEHAEALKQYGDAVLPVLAEFLTKPREEHIDNIGRELAVPVKTAADETPLRFAAQRAVYTDRKELVPYLCLHIHDQGWFFGDYGVSPASDAVNAINALEHRPILAGEMEALCKAETGNFPTAVH